MSKLDRYIHWEPDYVQLDDPIDCPACVDHEKQMYEAQGFLEAIVKQLYSGEPLDANEMENDLDELCHILHVKLIEGDLTIQRKGA